MQVNVNLGGVDALNPKLKQAIDRVNALTSKAGQAREKLKNIAITQNQIKGFEKLRTEVISSAAALQKAKDKAKDLGDLTKRSAFAIEPYKKATAEVKRLAESHDRLMAKTQAAKAAMAAKGVTTDRLTAQTKQLRLEEERLQKVMAREASINAARAKAGQMRSRAGSLAMGGAAAIGAGGVVLGGLGNAAQAYAEAEAASTSLKTAMMGVGGQLSGDFAKINDLATNLGNKLPGTTADFQDMMTMLIRQGMPAKTILEGTGEAAAYLGVQLKMAPAQAAEFAAKMQDALRAPAGDMMGVMDIIQRTFYAGVDPTNMLAGFAKASVGMDILRIKGVEGAKALAPLLAMADQSGLVGEASGNALRKVLQLSMNRADTGKYGMDFTNGQGEHAGLQKMFSELQKLKSLNTERRLEAIKDIFGNDAETIQMLTLMIEKGQGGYDEMVSKLQKQADLKLRVDASLGTLSATWEAANGTWTNAKASIGEQLAPELKDLSKWLGEVSQDIMDWTKENPKAARIIALLAAFVGILLVGLGGLALAIAAVLIPMAAMTVLTSILGIGLLPLTLIILGVMAAITALIALYVYWGDITSYVQEKWNQFTTCLGGLRDKFLEIGSQMITGLVDGITSGASRAWEATKRVVGGVIDKAKGMLGINSPSRVFMEFGGHTAAGLGLGIARGTPGVIANVGRMAAGVTTAGVATLTAGMAMAGAPGAGGALSAPGAGTMSIGQVTIVVEGGNGDPAAIARAVEERLRALNGRAKTAAQSRFYED